MRLYPLKTTAQQAAYSAKFKRERQTRIRRWRAPDGGILHTCICGAAGYVLIDQEPYAVTVNGVPQVDGVYIVGTMLCRTCAELVGKRAAE